MARTKRPGGSTASRSRTAPAGRRGRQGQDEDVPVVGLREPCPCGSGKRYKACHARARRQEATELVLRPFEGLAGECDWVAMREIVPAATATVRTLAAHGGEEVTVATVLPMAVSAMRRDDGHVMIGLQTPGGSGDPSRDIAVSLLEVLSGEPDGTTAVAGAPGPGPRLQDVVEPGCPFTVRVHSGFDFWLEGAGDASPAIRESMERANAAVVPTERLVSVEAAYWCRVGERRHLRWVFPDPEDAILDGLARLHAARSTALVDGSRYIGSFRAHGLLVPVWDLPVATEVDDLEEPAKAFEERLREAMAVDAPLTVDERRARSGVMSRQLTLR